MSRLRLSYDRQRELLESEDITRMDWPAYFPDLNPTEHVWDALGRRIAERLHHPENIQKLKQMLIEEWVLLPQEMLHQLVLSMRRRCEATIALIGPLKTLHVEGLMYVQSVEVQSPPVDEAIAPHIITPAVGAVCHCKVKTGLRHSPRGLHAQTRLSSMLRLNLDSSLKTTWFHSAAVQFPRAWHYSKRRHRWVNIKGSTRHGRHDPIRPSARRLRMVREDTGAPSAGATCAWMAADEAVGCTRAFLTMWRSSRRLVCRVILSLVFV
ncbi:uncharacterized protein TNCV_2426391 [Trichonephila clavipes]|nr:uncharacterized protein TNCV_2426391 [Trichonephila clavipes]